MIEKNYKYMLTNEKVIEKIVDDEEVLEFFVFKTPNPKDYKGE